jgi:PPOX class probable FMN-dependent enzyme
VAAGEEERTMIESVQDLRRIYAPPKPRAVAKQLDRLDPYCRRFIGLAPFLVLATVGKDGRVDASPRGGKPGFVQIIDDVTVHVPDAFGNNRLDSYTNIVESGRCGTIFFVPGMDETLRINGRAVLRNEPELLAPYAAEKHPPKVLVEIRVEEAYLHCAKALMRSRLWSPDNRIDRAAFPSIGEMIKAQSGSQDPAETQEQTLARYVHEL